MATFYRKSEIPEHLQRFFCPAEIGLEPTPEDYITKMVSVFREVRRILRDDGVLFLNVGDSYAMSTKGADGVGKQHSNAGSVMQDRSWRIPPGIKPKDLIGIPWLLAFALRADGWYLRQDIIWAKPNPMPESVTDRCTKAHEYLFLLTKNARYWYDAEAVKEKVADGTIDRLSQPTLAQQVGSTRVPGKTNGNMKAVGNSENRNRRSVWSIASQPFSGAHFATMPKKLVEPCILAGCPVGGTVLDPFNGAATVGIVALEHGRQYIGIELNPEYVRLSVGRLTDATRQGQLFSLPPIPRPAPIAQQTPLFEADA